MTVMILSVGDRLLRNLIWMLHQWPTSQY